jgi:hypothetical protein
VTRRKGREGGREEGLTSIFRRSDFTEQIKRNGQAADAKANQGPGDEEEGEGGGDGAADRGDEHQQARGQVGLRGGRREGGREGRKGRWVEALHWVCKRKIEGHL